MRPPSIPPAADGVQQHCILGDRISQPVEAADITECRRANGHVVSEAPGGNADADRPEVVLVQQGLLEGLEAFEERRPGRKLDPAENDPDIGPTKMAEHLFRPGGRQHAIPIGEQEHVPARLGECQVECRLLSRQPAGLPVVVDNARARPYPRAELVEEPRRAVP